jgi:DNA-binding NtrC family response regulator
MPESACKARVAVVDDEHIIADTLTEILNSRGFQAKALYSGEAAVEEVRDFRPQIVLSDVQMGGIDGVEAAIRIRRIHPECRIILFTASPVRHSIHAEIDRLGFEFIERPLHPQEVLDLLANRNSVAPHMKEPQFGQDSEYTAREPQFLISQPDLDHDISMDLAFSGTPI